VFIQWNCLTFSKGSVNLNFVRGRNLPKIQVMVFTAMKTSNFTSFMRTISKMFTA